MIAIMTKYIGATNTKPSRIKAYTSNKGQSITMPFEYDVDGMELYKRAAIALRDKMGWKGELIGGGTKDGYAFVFKP